MNFIKKPVILIALVMLGSSMTGRAQYQFQLDPFFSYFRDLGRYEIGVHYVLSAGEFAGTVPVGTYGSGQGDVDVIHPLTSGNLGGYIGTSIPFKATGHISLWAMDIGLNLNMPTWSGLNMASDFTAPSPMLTASTMQIGLPIGVEWEIGCHAIESKRIFEIAGLDRTHKIYGASLGAGFIPQVSMTTLANAPDVKTGYGYNCAPYVKAELVENHLFCTKLRIMYTIGDVNLLEVNHALPGKTDGPFKITSQSNLYLSLVIMPFTFRWKETSWWNIHDTYNHFDRLN